MEGQDTWFLPLDPNTMYASNICNNYEHEKNLICFQLNGKLNNNLNKWEKNTCYFRLVVKINLIPDNSTKYFQIDVCSKLKAAL